MGNIFGGTIMSWIDITASIVAFRHCRTAVVTASMDDLHFLHPVRLGELVMLKGSVNFTGNRSLEVGVKVIAENPLTGEQRHTASSYLTFVSLDADGKATPVPPLLPATAEEKRRFAEGQARKQARMARIGTAKI
jgi:acyl-CoA hydrolase